MNFFLRISRRTRIVSGIPVLLLIGFASEEEAVQARLRYLDDVFKLQQILRGSDRSGEPPSSIDREWANGFASRRSAMYIDYKEANPPRDHWNITPLPDLGSGL